MSTDVSPTVAIYTPAPGDMRLTVADKGGLHLDVANGRVWFTLGDPRFIKELVEEAAAMRKLAELATEAAAELERRVVTS